MATLLLSAAGAAIGGSFGGSVAGLSAGVIGRAVGATLGASIDQRLTGQGSEAVETGRVERFRVMGASEGAVLPRAFGRVRLAGQVIWSSRFLESVNTIRAGGKGGGGQAQKVREYSYSISLAVAICEGEITRVGRIWADGQRLDLSNVAWRLHPGGEDQLPDPLIAAIEGSDDAPAYRGTAYVVFEALELGPFGNRIPQFNFEVFRSGSRVAGSRPPALDVAGVALVPGTGEYSLATVPVHVSHGKGKTDVVNVNNDRGRPDFDVSLEQLRAELPGVRSVSLVVSWFGDDLRCGRCMLRPAVEQAEKDGQQMPWRVSGVGRFDAKLVSRLDGRPVFGGTPADASVLQAIARLRDAGQSVMFYPFILMDVRAGNALTDPWNGEVEQPPVPWRGRITLSLAPGLPGSPDGTAAAATEVAALFGAARPSDFRREGDGVAYEGPAEWSYRRFILHYAHLCAVSGGVDAFVIGSEMRSLTQIRDGADVNPAVRAMCDLARDVRGVLGPHVRIGYAADWSEYFGHHPDDGSGDVLFHLDPLWAHPDIDFIGIDNYMPLSDWRDGPAHADAAAGSIYDLDYLTSNVAGGEGYEWYYADLGGRERQERLPISDGAHGEPWVHRYKDIRNWWSRPHHDRVGGERRSQPTAWVPRSKPIWFTELGCPAVDKGTNQPNLFYDPKSAESFLPYFSAGSNDTFIQRRYLQAMFSYWGDPANNPVSSVYCGPMVDMGRAHVWAWDARPWPDFPDRLETWTDGRNFEIGHWINARLALPALGEVVAEISERCGAGEVDVSALHGGVTGYAISAVESGRQSLQPLMLAYGFDAFAAEGALAFRNRGIGGSVALAIDEFVVAPGSPALASTRAAPTEATGRVALEFVRADADYAVGAAEAMAPEASEPDVLGSSLPVVLAEGEAKAVAERWLSEERIGRETLQFELAPSRLLVGAGDLVSLGVTGDARVFRIDRVEEFGRRSMSATRVELGVYGAPSYRNEPVVAPGIRAPTPVYAEFLDLPLLSGEEVPHAPHVAIVKTPWAGAVSIFSAPNDFGYAFNREILRPAIMGETLEALPAATPGLWSERSLRVRLASGVLQSQSRADVLNGANAAAVRAGGSDWEVMQFAQAELVGPHEYALSGLLRGQAGTDGVMPSVWPSGADFVLDEALVQIALPSGARGLERHYRIGPATRPYDDPSYLHTARAFAGVGLRPYAPAHLRAKRLQGGDVEITWVRRTRVEGDSWEGANVPLGEEREAYLVVISTEAAPLRTYDAETNRIIYPAADWAEDGGPASVRVDVAQVSARFGPGPAAWISLDLG